MKLVTVSQMKAIEKEADANGLTYDQMMENAGQGLAEAIQDLPIVEEDREIFGLVGAGDSWDGCTGCRWRIRIWRTPKAFAPPMDRRSSKITYQMPTR